MTPPETSSSHHDAPSNSNIDASPVSYDSLWSQIASLVKYEKDPIASLANIASVVYFAYADSDRYVQRNNSESTSGEDSSSSEYLTREKNVNWFGFYLRNLEREELILGPFVGRLACTRIRKGKGVCGAAWKQEKSFLVPDVHQFPNHIACDSASQSEIVVPLMVNKGDKKVCIGVLDVDSTRVNAFDESDLEFLEKVANLLAQNLDWSVIAPIAKLLQQEDADNES